MLRVVPPLVQKGRGAVSGSARGVPSTSRRRPGRSRGALRRVCAAGPVRRDCRRSRMGTLAPRAHCADGVGCGRCRWPPRFPGPRGWVAVPARRGGPILRGFRWAGGCTLGGTPRARAHCMRMGGTRPAGWRPWQPSIQGALLRAVRREGTRSPIPRGNGSPCPGRSRPHYIAIYRHPGILLSQIEKTSGFLDSITYNQTSAESVANGCGRAHWP